MDEYDSSNSSKDSQCSTCITDQHSASSYQQELFSYHEYVSNPEQHQQLLPELRYLYELKPSSLIWTIVLYRTDPHQHLTAGNDMSSLTIKIYLGVSNTQLLFSHDDTYRVFIIFSADHDHSDNPDFFLSLYEVAWWRLWLSDSLDSESEQTLDISYRPLSLTTASSNSHEYADSTGNQTQYQIQPFYTCWAD